MYTCRFTQSLAVLVRLLAITAAAALYSSATAAQKNPVLFSERKIPAAVHFAVVADLTGGEQPGVFTAAAQSLKALAPDFVVTVGDLIEGGSHSRAQLNNEWQSFKERAALIGAPVYPLVGNHDIANPTQRQWWLETVGARYYHVRRDDILFLMLDSEDFTDQRFAEMARIRQQGIAVYRQNPEAFAKTQYAQLYERQYGAISAKQSDYFLQVLKDHRDVRWTFVLMHKPVWEGDRGHFQALETALQDRPYTVFNGHVHKYHHSNRFGRDYIQMGTTGGAHVPAPKGQYLDHILWVSIKANSKPELINIELSGFVDKRGAPELTKTKTKTK